MAAASFRAIARGKLCYSRIWHWRESEELATAKATRRIQPTTFVPILFVVQLEMSASADVRHSHFRLWTMLRLQIGKEFALISEVDLILTRIVNIYAGLSGGFVDSFHHR
jgi:hypothetical protein